MVPTCGQRACVRPDHWVLQPVEAVRRAGLAEGWATTQRQVAARQEREAAEAAAEAAELARLWAPRLDRKSVV